MNLQQRTTKFDDQREGKEIDEKIIVEVREKPWSNETRGIRATCKPKTKGISLSRNWSDQWKVSTPLALHLFLDEKSPKDRKKERGSRTSIERKKEERATIKIALAAI